MLLVLNIIQFLTKQNMYVKQEIDITFVNTFLKNSVKGTQSGPHLLFSKAEGPSFTPSSMERS